MAINMSTRIWHGLISTNIFVKKGSEKLFEWHKCPQEWSATVSLLFVFTVIIILLVITVWSERATKIIHWQPTHGKLCDCGACVKSHHMTVNYSHVLDVNKPLKSHIVVQFPRDRLCIIWWGMADRACFIPKRGGELIYVHNSNGS